MPLSKGKNWKKLKSRSEHRPPTEINFFKLISDGYISKYQSCKIEILYSNTKDTKDSTILFAKLAFSKDAFSPINEPNYFKFKLKFSKNEVYNFGLLKLGLTIQEGINFYNCIKENSWPLNKGFNVFLNNLIERYPRYVKADSKYVNAEDKDSFSVLLGLESEYNVINNGSYIIEFADCEKTQIKRFFSHDKVDFLEEIQNELNKISQINILSFSDKLGNIFFEFPIDGICLRRLESDCKIRVKFNSYFNPYPNIDLIYTSKPVDGKSEVYLQKLPKDKVIKFKFNKEPFTVTLYDRVRSITLAKSNNCEYERPYAGESQTITIYNNPMRSITINGNTIRTNPIFLSPNETDLKYEDWVALRKNENQTVINRKNLIAKEYSEVLNGSDPDDEHKKAVDDVRELMKMHGKSGIYLIDPYIEPIQILKTFYFYNIAEVEMKIIGDRQSLEKLYGDIDWRSKIKNFMNESSNHFGINLEFRIGFNVDHFNLHDRFLIFPFSHSEKRPVAWSLGTSLNSIGKSFHTLTKVDNARAILNAFNSLWKKTSGEECLIYKIKK